MNTIRSLVAILALGLTAALSAFGQGFTVIPTSQEDAIMTQVVTNQTTFSTLYNLFAWPVTKYARDGVSFKGWGKSGDVLVPCDSKYPAPLYAVPGGSPSPTRYISWTDWRIIEGYFRFTPSVPPLSACDQTLYAFNFEDELNNWRTEKVSYMNPAGGTNVIVLIRPEMAGAAVAIDRKNASGVWEQIGQASPGETLVIQYPKFTGGKEIRGAFSLGGSGDSLSRALTVRVGVKKSSWNPAYWAPY